MDRINHQYLEALNRYCSLLVTRCLNFWPRSSHYPAQSETLVRGIFNQFESTPLLQEFETKIKKAEEKIEEIKEKAGERGVIIPLEKLCADYELNKDEWIILSLLFINRFSDKMLNGLQLLQAVSFNENPLSKIELLSPKGKLRETGLIKSEGERRFNNERLLLFEQSFSLNEEIFWQIAGVENGPELEGSETDRTQGSLLLIREPEVSFEHLVLPTEMKEKIDNALWQYENGSEVYERYGLKEKIPYGRAVVMLFYGPPGTGKTATSEAIARQLNKKIGVANYAQIYDPWVGESEKNIIRTFAEAKRHNCIILFDEADALFSQRLNESHSVDRMHNLMTNLLMQKLERFSGIIILTTNREVVIDKAFERRILLKLKFEMPNQELRAKIWHFFLKDCPQLNQDISFAELGSYHLTGGKIKNAIIKTVMRCAKENRPITMPDLIHSAEEEIKSDFRKGERIGF